jgi:hypothetical protein
MKTVRCTKDGDASPQTAQRLRSVPRRARPVRRPPQSSRMVASSIPSVKRIKIAYVRFVSNGARPSSVTAAETRAERLAAIASYAIVAFTLLTGNVGEPIIHRLYE